MQKISVTTLILPVAGLGTRLHPLTLTTPKALVLVAGRPLLDYMLDEAQVSGIRTVALVINPTQRKAFETYVKERQKFFPKLTFYIRLQHQPLGDGHAVLQAADIIGNRPFAVRFSDDVVLGTPPVLYSLIRHAVRRNGSVILLERVPWKLVSRYGVVGGKALMHGVHRITHIVEKPAVKNAPSNLTVVGGYVLMPSVMRSLKRMGKALSVTHKDALRLSAVLEEELAKGKKMYGWELTGKRLDCGTLEGIAYAERFIRQPANRESGAVIA